ncbi:MAG: cytochrome c [Bacteroidetes bacterium]|jgi:cytochrome c551/c552|nr:cytochrome c [Bacteroidota bacterium]
MKKSFGLIFLAIINLLLFSCSNSGSSHETTNTSLGIGKFTKVELKSPLDQEMVTKGQKVFISKCIGCHQLDDKKLVGPGWKGVTSRFSPEWIMNFTSNTDVMLNQDSTAKALLIKYIVRMPQLNPSDEEVRAVYEFMRKNDGQ